MTLSQVYPMPAAAAGETIVLAAAKCVHTWTIGQAIDFIIVRIWTAIMVNAHMA